MFTSDPLKSRNHFICSSIPGSSVPALAPAKLNIVHGRPDISTSHKRGTQGSPHVIHITLCAQGDRLIALDRSL